MLSMFDCSSTKGMEYVADALLDKVAANTSLECPRVTPLMPDPSQEQLSTAMQKTFVQYLPKVRGCPFACFSMLPIFQGLGR